MRERGANLEKCWKNVKIVVFFDIFGHILNKKKNNLGQKCVKGGFDPSRAKLEQLPLISLKNDSFSSFDPTFPPVPP